MVVNDQVECVQNCDIAESLWVVIVVCIMLFPHSGRGRLSRQ
jgi:hypothetical protein